MMWIWIMRFLDRLYCFRVDLLQKVLSHFADSIVDAPDWTVATVSMDKAEKIAWWFGIRLVMEDKVVVCEDAWRRRCIS